MPGFRIDSQNLDSVDAGLGGKDINRTHRWRLHKFGDIDGVDILSKDEVLYTKSVEMPDISFDEIQVMGGSTVYKFASKPNFGDLTIAFYDLIGLEPKISKWQYKVWNYNTGIGVAGDYKSEVKLYLTDGMGDPVDYMWVFVNAWPKAIRHGSLVYDSSDLKLLTVVISYDWIRRDPTAGLQGSRNVQKAATNITNQLSAAARSLTNLF